MADTPRQPLPDLEAQRSIISQHLSEFRENNMRAQIRLSFLPKFKVGADTGRNAAVQREISDLKLQAENARIAILELEPQLAAVEAKIKDEQQSVSENAGQIS